MSYNGHKCWAYWNVALWLSNDELMYKFVCINLRFRTKDQVAQIIAANFDKTPDGARYSKSAVRAALVDWA
jgi:hypothetical protein